MRTCRVGKCELKLSGQTIEKLRAEVDWTKPTAKAAVESVLRQLAYGYVTELENGNSALAVYLDSAKPTAVATEFESMIDRMPTLTEYQPELWRYLRDFPKATFPDSTNFLYWQVTQFFIPEHICSAGTCRQSSIAATIATQRAELIRDAGLQPVDAGALEMRGTSSLLRC